VRACTHRGELRALLWLSALMGGCGLLGEGVHTRRGELHTLFWLSALKGGCGLLGQGVHTPR